MKGSWAELVARGNASPNRAKRQNIVLLRGLLVVAVGALLIDAGVGTAGFAALALVIVFALSDLVLLFLPARHLGKDRFDLVVGGIDLVLVGVGLLLADAAAGALPISCLLMVLVVALGGRNANAVAGAAAVGALHAWLILRLGTGPGIGRELGLQTLFLCAVGLYYGVLVEGIHRSRQSERADDLQRKELTTLLEILDDVTSSLELRDVTREIVTKMTAIVPAVRCSMVYVDEAMTRCFVVASHDNPDLNMLELDLRKYPEIREAIQTRQCVIIEDICSHPLMAEVRKYLVGLDFQSIIVVPITFGADVLGTLCLRTARGDHKFTEREVKFCTAVARASANALKNAFLHRQVVEAAADHRRTGEKLGRILNNSPDLILTTDNEGLITEFNRGAEKLLGYQKDELLGQPYGKLLAEPDEELLAKVRSFGVLPNYAQPMKTRAGMTLDLELHMSVLKDEDDAVAGSVWVGRDLTALKAAQTKLVQAEKLSTIGEVISGVAHELNNPLSGVLGFSQLLMARHGDGPLVRELEKINESAQRCQKIVKNLLSFARAHKPERKYLGVNGILEKTLDLKKYQLHVNNIEVERHLDEELPLTMVDFHQLQQVFLNLINNAQHAMAAVPERPGRLTVRTSHADQTLRIEITDNGEGMDQETIERIFDPFFTTKEPGEGTGLGLSVSYGIIKEHGGQIYARSHKGQGTTFLVELPVWKEAADEPGSKVSSADTAVAAAGSHPGGQILVVDDEPLVIDLLLDVLTEAGHRVDTAANGVEACRKVGDRRYDLVITDVRMPEMNGIDLYRHVLTTRPELEGKVIFVTGDLIDKNVVDFLAEVNARTIPKPLEIHQVTDTVSELLGTPTH